MMNGDKAPITLEAAASAARTAIVEGRWLDAIACYRVALQMPEAASVEVRPVLLGNLGRALLEAKLPKEAVATFREAAALGPESPVAQRNLGDGYAALGEMAEAAQAYAGAIALDAEDWLARTRFGNVLMTVGRRDLAIPQYREAARLRGDDAGVVRNLGNALLGANQLDEAEQVLRAALRLAPESADAQNSYGSVALRQGRLETAERAFERALELSPESVDALTNLGTLRMRQRRCDEAEGYYLRALELQPESAGAHYNLGLCCLQRGDYGRGWSELEWRGAVVDGGVRRQQVAEPQWRGEALDGATILLHAEQGFGDTIQFARYVSLVAERGRVVVQVQPELVRLMRGSLRGLEVLGVGETLPEFRWQCSLMSLPLAFGTMLDTIPGASGYLAADADDVSRMWARWPREGAKRRVGLAWSGSPGNRNNGPRSIPLEMLVAACEGVRAEVELFSLQQGKAGELPEASAVRDACRSCVDFADTAALVETMDLVIAVDTAVAHLAGALGKRVWVLLSDVSDWRWLDECEDSPWYDSARLFRQRVPGDWAELCERLGRALTEWVSEEV